MNEYLLLVCMKVQHSLGIDLDQTTSEVETSVVIVFHQEEKGICFAQLNVEL